MTLDRKNRKADKKNDSLTKREVRGTKPAHVSLSATYSGPLPPPQVLDFYDKCVPGAANRIIAMAEKQQEHRLRIEEKAVDKSLEANKMGQIFAFVIAVLALLAITFLGYHGMQTTASALAVVTGGGIVGAFITGRKEQKSTMAEKAKKLMAEKKKIEDASKK